MLMVVGGSRAVQLAERGWRVRLDRWDVWLLVLGAVLALVAFMWDGLLALVTDMTQLGQVKPTGFLWPAYLAGLALAGVAVYRMLFGSAVPPSPLLGSSESSERQSNRPHVGAGE